jgi:hypothetical protein
MNYFLFKEYRETKITVPKAPNFQDGLIFRYDARQVSHSRPALPLLTLLLILSILQQQVTLWV